MNPSYAVYQNHIELLSPEGSILTVYKTADSGRLVTRQKLQTIFGVFHPGIMLGKDENGTQIVIHHHYKHTVPVIHTISEYGDGAEVSFDDRDVHYSQHEILIRALQLWKEQASYDLFNQNCQHFVTKAACNEAYSESTHKGITWILIGIVVLLVLYVVYRSKNAALGMATIALGGLTLNEIYKARIASSPMKRAKNLDQSSSLNYF